MSGSFSLFSIGGKRRIGDNAIICAPCVCRCFIMAVVIRLQGLRITAGSEDIRNFFTGLRIPDGGVHIIGGDLEEAFIIFMSDEDARRAMTRSGGLIKGSRVNLLLSSKSEMQSVLEESARKSEAKARGLYKEVVSRPSQEPGRLTFNKEPRTDIRRPDHLEMRNRPSPSSTSESRSQSDASNRDGLYMKLVGLPFSATKEDILNFFEGLQVDDIVLSRNHHGAPSGQGFVRFASRDDTMEGMKRDYQYIGPRYIKLSRSTEEVWLKAGGSVPHKRQSAERARSRSPVSVSSCTPPHEDFCVLFENLSFTVEKRDIRALLLPVVVKDSQITVFNPKKEDKSRSAVVVFKSLEDYCAGLSHNKKPFLHKMLYVSPISKEKMVSMLMAFVDSREEGLRRTSEGPASQRSTPDSELRCVYVRNLPFDVRKVEVMDFFHGFGLSEEKVILLRDEQGVGLGEALVIFQSGKEALMAQSLNGQRFLGSEVMLRCISMTQMQDFGLGNQQLATRPQERIYQRLEGQVNDGSFNDSPSFSNQMFRDGPDVQPGLHQSDRDCFDQNFAPNRFRAGRDEEQNFYGSSNQQFEGPTCVKLYNLPSHIRIDEIYDFCYGYSVIPGSASFEYGRDGGRSRSATVQFETHREALVALEELRGRPIGTRKIQTAFV